MWKKFTHGHHMLRYRQTHIQFSLNMKISSVVVMSVIIKLFRSVTLKDRQKQHMSKFSWFNSDNNPIQMSLKNLNVNLVYLIHFLIFTTSHIKEFKSTLVYI